MLAASSAIVSLTEEKKTGCGREKKKEFEGFSMSFFF